jgi:hypothetical protein
MPHVFLYSTFCPKKSMKWTLQLYPFHSADNWNTASKIPGQCHAGDKKWRQDLNSSCLPLYTEHFIPVLPCLSSHASRYPSRNATGPGKILVSLTEECVIKLYFHNDNWYFSFSSISPFFKRLAESIIYSLEQHAGEPTFVLQKSALFRENDTVTWLILWQKNLPQCLHNCLRQRELF